MNIALLSEKYTPDIGGLAISTERLARLMAAAGHEVRIICPSLNVAASEARTHSHDGIRVTRFGAQKRVDDTLLDWFELIVEEHRRQPFDLLHAYFLARAGFVASYAGSYLGLPSVVSIRGNDIERSAFDPAAFSHVMFALQNASALTTNASVLRAKAHAFVEREITLIPNGVDTELFRPTEQNAALAERLGLHREMKEGRVIGFVGELRAKKGLSTLLHAYAQVNQVQSAALLIVGDARAGEDQKRFDEIKSSIPNQKITLTGYVSNQDLPSYYSLMDVIIHPSVRDGLPNVLLEAMACERAVVATTAGGVLDVVEDCKNGRTAPINDVDSIAAIVQELLSDKPQRVTLGRSARSIVQRRFTLQSELDGNRAVYRKLGLQG